MCILSSLCCSVTLCVKGINHTLLRPLRSMCFGVLWCALVCFGVLWCALVCFGVL